MPFNTSASSTAGSGHASARQADVILVSMPWTILRAPSIQLGLLKAVLDREGVRNEALHLYVDFLSTIAARVPDRRISIDRLETFGEIFGEWTFSVPPFRNTAPEEDESFRALMSPLKGPEWVEVALRVRALVPAFLSSCVEQILAWQPRVVGFSSTFQQNVPSLVLAKLLKLRRPDLHIVFGGANCEGPMGEGLHQLFPWIDVVVRGEAEHLVSRLFRELLDGRSISRKPGLCFRENGESVVCDDTAIDSPEKRPQEGSVVLASGKPGSQQRGSEEMGVTAPVSMDNLPLPVYDDYFERLRMSPLADKAEQLWLPYESARGCWWAIKKVCTFCAANAQYFSFRSKRPETVLRDIAELSNRYDSRRIWFVDNIMEERYLRELFPRMVETPVPMFVEMRAHVSRKHLHAMRDAGVAMVQIGVESLSTPILKLIDKGTTAIQNVRVIKWCAELGIRAFYNLIYGFPGEPAEEYDRMADVMLSLTHLEPPNPPVRLRLDRFSPYYRDPERYGIEVLGPYRLRRFVYDLPVEALQEIEYFFAFRYKDGRDPEAYAARFVEACNRWRSMWQENIGALSYHPFQRGLRIYDCRSNVENKIYELGEFEARVYLACDAGAKPHRAWEALPEEERRHVDVNAVRDMLADLARRRLMLMEGDLYLSLALQGNNELRAHHEHSGVLPVERLRLRVLES